MTPNPLCRVAVSATLGPRREAAPRRHRRSSPRSRCPPRRPRAWRRSRFGPCRWTESGRSSSSPGRFDLVGLRWHGPGSVRFSVRSTDGRWGPWLDAAVARKTTSRTSATREDAGDEWLAARQPDVGRPGERDPVSRHGPGHRPAGVVRPQPGAEDPAAGGRDRGRTADRARGAPGARTSRSGATQPELRAGRPLRDRAPHGGPERLLAAQAAAIMRGIQIYHVKSNGWNDIGYNFLVDRYGTVYEGRYGGIDKNVIGAHALGFNTGSVGVAVIGTFDERRHPGAAPRSLEKLLAWRLDLAHVDPARDGLRRLRRQRALPCRHPGLAAGRLGPSRHGPDVVPRRQPLRATRRRSRARRSRSACRSCSSRR